MFKKATKKQCKLRLALFSPSGGGKTYSALRIATGLGGKIAVIDTERGSASKYADHFTFDVVDLKKTNINEYCKYIELANDYDVLIIDSLSHGWQELLDEIDRIAKVKYKGNTWSAWSEGGIQQKKLINSILNFNGHIIVTMRSKTEWATEKMDNGKNKPVRVGLSPEQGKGIEYEFDLLMELNTEHVATVIKDRTGKFQDSMIEKPDEKFGESLTQWLNDGADELEEALKEVSECKALSGLQALWNSYPHFQKNKQFINLVNLKKQELPNPEKSTTLDENLNTETINQKTIIRSSKRIIQTPIQPTSVTNQQPKTV